METTIYYPEQHPDVTVVEVHGEVEVGESGCGVLSRLFGSLLAGGDRFMVVDLQEAGPIAEGAYAELLGLYGRLRLRGGDMILVAPPGEVLKALTTVGFDKLTLILDDTDVAIEQAAVKAGALQ